MSKVKPHDDWDEVEALLARGDPPTPDEVSITSHGRRLDSAGAKMARELAGIFRDWVITDHRPGVGDRPVTSGFVAHGDPG